MKRQVPKNKNSLSRLIESVHNSSAEGTISIQIDSLLGLVEELRKNGLILLTQESHGLFLDHLVGTLAAARIMFYLTNSKHDHETKLVK